MKPARRYPLPDLLFVYLMNDEGGLVDDPNDAGGLTKYGISQRAYPALDIRALDMVGAQRIYERDYWHRAYIDQLPKGLDYAVFDYAVNSGPSRAIKALQRLVGATADGELGDRTLAKVREYCSAHGKPYAIGQYCIARGTWLAGLNQPRFIKGWLARVQRVQKRATEWVYA